MLFGRRYHLYIFAVGANCQGAHRWIAGDRIRFTHKDVQTKEKRGVASVQICRYTVMFENYKEWRSLYHHIIDLVNK